MDQPNNEAKKQDNNNGETNSVSKSKSKHRSTKKKCDDSSSSSDGEDILPENILETEKHVHASAVKNNLDEISVRKLLKKVVTNDHVLALVKLREEEEKGLDTNENKPTKLTRSKIKELMKVSPKSSSWKTWDLQLSPIKHIPVKTRPEVTALIAQDLPEDEDDDEYEPNHDDAPSDDDQTLESCSDIESQPRTPATPKTQHLCSPKVVKDGPFLVPQRVSATKRKLELDEEDATIARRTRSKLSLSSTSIEHIESTFVPPDDIPMPAVDDLWNQFLTECLNPASTSKNEEDDEADPEYNVAADADAAEEDDENLGKSIMRISKKELNDLVTELFGIMPEAMEEEDLAENLATTVLTDSSQTDLTTHWEGKQEPLSDEEVTVKISDKLTFEKREVNPRLSIGKTEPDDEASHDEVHKSTTASTERTLMPPPQQIKQLKFLPKPSSGVKIAVKEQTEHVKPSDAVPAPPILRYLRLKTSTIDMSAKTDVIQVEIDPDFTILPEQIQIMQQQLRQHIQLATSNFLQLYVHPIHWSYGPTYKVYIETFIKMWGSNPHSVVNVCNLRPAFDLMTSWEKSVSEDTHENAEMIKFIQDDCEKSRRRIVCHNLHNGEFHDTLKNVIANSTVFLYPHLLPPTPYRGDNIVKKFHYLRSEDELIAIGLDEFWHYVENNSKLFKLRSNARTKRRPGLFMTVQLVAKHMFPWVQPKVLMNHIIHIRKHGDTENPISKFFKSRDVVPVDHKLIPFNPKLSLYEQPVNEMPRVWLRYLAKTSKRFKAHLYRSSTLCGRAPEGVSVEIGKSIEIPQKNPLPIDFTKEIYVHQPSQSYLPKPDLIDKCDLDINNVGSKDNVVMAANLYSVVETSTGAFLVPLSLLPTNTVNSTNTPVSSSVVIQGTIVGNNLPENSVTISQKIEEGSTTKANRKTLSKRPIDNDHCKCCKILRRMCDGGQTLMMDFFKPNTPVKRGCYCKDIKRPKITNRLKLFISNYRCQSKLLYQEIENKLTGEEKTDMENGDFLNANDLAFVTLYELRLLRRISTLTNNFKNRIHLLFSKFNIGVDDPVQLAKDLHKAVNKDLIEIYTEFLGFLTAEQAETTGVFNAYLASHLRDLIKMIEEEMRNKEKRDAVLKQLQTIFTGKYLTPCDTCSGLLPLLGGYPRIAKHLFGLFPHKRVASDTKEEQVIIVSKPPEALTATSVKQEDHLTPINNEKSPSTQAPANIQITYNSNCIVIQPECEDTERFDVPNKSDEETNVPKTNENDDMMSTYSEPAMVIIEEEIKTEPVEWKRDEDKLILEMLKESLTPEQRKYKTIIEILEEKNVIKLISDCLLDKTIDEIHERVLYLLEILVFSENS